MGNSQFAGSEPVRIFVSHASADGESAREVAGELVKVGSLPWLAMDEIRAGENYAESIVDALEACDAVVVLVSRDSIASPHVRREMNIAIDRRKQILPFAFEIALSSGQDLPVDWKYWFGVVQVEPYVGPRETAELVVRRLQRATPPEVHRKPARPAVAPDDHALDVRTALVQTASAGQDFMSLLFRLRRYAIPRADIEENVRGLRDRGLVDFEDPLVDATIFHLSN